MELEILLTEGDNFGPINAFDCVLQRSVGLALPCAPLHAQHSARQLDRPSWQVPHSTLLRVWRLALPHAWHSQTVGARGFLFPVAALLPGPVALLRGQRPVELFWHAQPVSLGHQRRLGTAQACFFGFRRGLKTVRKTILIGLLHILLARICIMQGSIGLHAVSMLQLVALLLDKPRNRLAEAQDQLMQCINYALLALDWRDTSST